MDRIRARELARTYLSRGEPAGWFDALYAESCHAKEIPWADLVPNPNLVEWFEASTIEAKSKQAIVVGCGLGDDAEFLSDEGFNVTAFDVSPAAIRWWPRGRGRSRGR